MKECMVVLDVHFLPASLKISRLSQPVLHSVTAGTVFYCIALLCESQGRESGKNDENELFYCKSCIFKENEAGLSEYFLFSRINQTAFLLLNCESERGRCNEKDEMEKAGSPVWGVLSVGGSIAAAFVLFRSGKRRQTRNGQLCHSGRIGRQRG